jgi:hypothetical protein
MHRSGTSFAARSLALLGVSFGDEAQLMGPGPDNATGYWENRFIKELDDELLSALGGSWDQPPVLDPGWERDPALEPFRARGSALLDGAFGPPSERPEWISFKDPRFSLLLPFWRTLVSITTTVVIVRDPLEVAASLRSRNGIDTPQACLLWLRYLLAATGNDPGRLLVRHSDFFDALPATLDRLAGHLGLPAPTPPIVAAAESHLDPGLRHHRSEDRRELDNPILELSLAVWNDGDVMTDAVDPLVGSAIGRGWLRPPIETHALDEARAKVVELTERLRKRARARKAAAAAERTPDER